MDLQPPGVDSRFRHPSFIRINEQRRIERQADRSRPAFLRGCDNLTRDNGTARLNKQGRFGVQAVTLAEVSGQVAREKCPKTCMPWRAVTAIVVGARIGADIPALHHRTQETGTQQQGPLLVREVLGLHYTLVLILQLLQHSQRRCKLYVLIVTHCYLAFKCYMSTFVLLAILL